jgi:hypothetical protein
MSLYIVLSNQNPKKDAAATANASICYGSGLS